MHSIQERITSRNNQKILHILKCVCGKAILDITQGTGPLSSRALVPSAPLCPCLGRRVPGLPSLLGAPLASPITHSHTHPRAKPPSRLQANSGAFLCHAPASLCCECCPSCIPASSPRPSQRLHGAGPSSCFPNLHQAAEPRGHRGSRIG